MEDYRYLYQRFIKANSHRLMMTAHSHHFWPDITREAMLQYWDDSAKFVDQKWEYFFHEIVPKTQSYLAKILGHPRPQDISFAPNTHDLLSRLLSTHFEKTKVRVLTTKSEFHSFSRQIRRLQEWDKFEVDLVSTDTQEQFVQGMLGKLEKKKYDFVFVSQVFFNTGLYLKKEALKKILAKIPLHGTHFCLDAYHSLGAIPFELQDLTDHIFILGGSYKYLQAGEGLCFMSLPKNHQQLRPLLTGWFSSFASLDKTNCGNVQYALDGMKFWGSTIDMSSFYRFNAVWEQFEHEGIALKDIHQHVMELQQYFLKGLDLSGVKIMKGAWPRFQKNQLAAHFLTYQFPDMTDMSHIDRSFRKQGIYTDYRGHFLRLGFGLHHHLHDMDKLLKLLCLAN